MKSVFTFVIACSIMFFVSCKKEGTALQQNVFIKSVKTDFDMVVVSGLQLDDGNYIVAGFDVLSTHPGEIIKADPEGKIIWQKSLSSKVMILWSVFSVPGKGFAAFGVDDLYGNYKYICLYNMDGNLLSTDSFSTTYQNYRYTPSTMMRLSNGNYVVAGGGWSTGTELGTIRIFNPTFHQIYSKIYTLPANKNLAFCRSLCELPGDTISIIANVSLSNADIENLYIIKADINGNVLSKTFLNDTVYSETATAEVPYNGGVFAVTARMVGNNFGINNQISNLPPDGVFVNYFNSYNGFGQMASGMINLNHFTSDGQLINQTIIKEYPNNGMMNSIRKTNDGGYILCGTVNQLNTMSVPSELKIYLMKLDPNLNVQWSRIINSTYQTFGVDAIQTSDGGYLITGAQRSFDKRSMAIIIKTDASGNIY